MAQRRVVITPVEHGMAELWAYLPAEQAAAITATLDAIAYATVHGKGGDPRTGDQRRADAFVDLCTAPLGDPNLTDRARATTRGAGHRRRDHPHGFGRPTR